MPTTIISTRTNDVHKSTINLHVKNGELTAPQVRRSKGALCGVYGCTCSDETGTRGTQDVTLEDQHDGTWTVAEKVAA